MYYKDNQSHKNFNNLKAKLEQWTNAFPNRKPIELKNELDQLRARNITPATQSSSEAVKKLQEEIIRLKNVVAMQKAQLSKSGDDKPVMKNVGTQTELTFEDLKEMYKTQKAIENMIKNSKMIKDEEKEKSVLFKLGIIERGISTLREDKEHNIENGRELNKCECQLIVQIEVPPKNN